MSASAVITLDTRRVKKTEKYPVKLRVSSQGKSQDYQTIYDLNEDEFKKLSAKHPSAELQTIRDQLKTIRTTATKICEDLRDFSFEKFERDLYGGIVKTYLRSRKRKKEGLTFVDDDFDFTPFEKRFSILKEVHPGKDFMSFTFYSYIVNLLKEARIGSALNYQDTYNCLKRFKGNVRFSAITVTYLIQFENWLLKDGCSKSTVGIKLRPLRAIFNEAIASGIIRREDCYPFGRRKYQIPTSRNVKKALELDDIQKIFDYQSDDEKVIKARDLWLFCYLGNGMNPKDMLFLKFKNIDGEYLIFERAKTERSTRNDPKPISVYLGDEIREIIKKWGNPEKQSNNYIFPIMRDNLNILEQHNLVKSVVIFINKGMAVVTTGLQIRKSTSISARHSFSTVLKRSGVSTEFIQESLGHKDKKTTENYLDSFENKVKKEYAGRLTAFKKANSAA